jgi:GDP-mannose mannosyl hydrolase
MSTRPRLVSTTNTEPKPGEWLDPQDFEHVVRLTPLVSMDLIVRSPDGRVLVGRRLNEPAKDSFFLVGGRITKNESRAAAFRRLTREELGIELTIDQARFLGVYDHFYPTNRFEKPGFGTHYVVLGYELFLSCLTANLPREQHGEYLWKTEAELLASPDVHQNTKAYFRPTQANACPSTSPAKKKQRARSR